MNNNPQTKFTEEVSPTLKRIRIAFFTVSMILMLFITPIAPAVYYMLIG